MRYRHATGQLRHKNGMLLGVSALACIIGVQGAFAQEDFNEPSEQPIESGLTEAEADVIVVQGIRQSLETAAETKRNADTFVDSITASDISTLPDLSIAEALGRIPGVTVSRFSTGGASPDFPSPEGAGNLIRGLGFVRSEFNGRDAFTANGGRALDFASIPPELVGAVDVYKNQSADLIEGGIGGTINLRTLEPFDRSGPVLALIGDYTYTDLRDEWSPTIAGIAGNRWDTDVGEFGLLVSVSTSKLKSDINGWQQAAPTPRPLDLLGTDSGDPAAADPDTGEAPGVGVIFEGYGPDEIGALVPGFQLRTNEVDRDRQSYYAAAQWQNDFLRATIKFVRVENDTDSLEHTTEYFPSYATANRLQYSDVVFDPSFSSAGIPICGPEAPVGDRAGCEQLIPVSAGLMEEGVVSAATESYYGAYGVPVTSLGIGKHDEAMTQDISFNFQWNVTDNWFAEFDMHHTKADASFSELWGGLNTPLQVLIRPDLDNPEVEFNFDPRLALTSFADPAGNNPEWMYPTSTADPMGTWWQFAADSYRQGDGDLSAYQADVQYESPGDSWFDGVKFGVRYSERDQVNRVANLNWGAIKPAWNGGLGLGAFFNEPAFEAVDFSDFYRGGVVQGSNTEFLYVRSDLLLDYDSYISYLETEPDIQFDADNPDADDEPWAPVRGSRGAFAFNPDQVSDIEEKTENAYVRFDFGQEFGNGMSIDGNVGVRYVQTSLASSGFIDYQVIPADAQQPVFDPETGERLRTDDAESRDDLADFQPAAVAYFNQGSLANGFDNKYEEWLPSFNAKWNLNDEMLIRVGASRALSRPNVQDLRAGQTYSARTTRTPFPALDEDDPLFGVDRGAQNIELSAIGASGGNPGLLPTTAWNLDLSYEWYFDGGYFSIAGFNKELENIIVGGAESIGTATIDGRTIPVTYSGQVNQDSATVRGIEVAYQQFYDFLPGILGNLGMQANYTFIDASAEPPQPFVDGDGDGEPDDFATIFRFGVDDLLGQSSNVANVVGIYQDEKIELRLAYNWRDEYLTSYRGYVTGSPVFNKAAGFLDASFKYDFNDHFQFRTSIANILDTKNKAEVQINPDGQMADRFSFLNDRRIVFGLRYQY
ncbi:TonB-dependent receptor [Parvularcula dongshanensis]|uniref:TonB-dependent receptor n=1 Tax=Parvularcula dongshanensis TaxID=1173995 RepID=A0A840I606_9PROT|nr:TonB-dependent receptor [Parvularcula dongshanensis]MBB4659701.1 TonB-dependent receptor [Parvularcula dongshanensis]